MSVFKTKGVVIKINKIQNNDFLYTIFSYDYGIIRTSKKISKKEKNIDLGYIINFEIETKEDKDIHKIKNIKIKSEFNLKNKSFKIINSYLELLAIILKNIPSKAIVYEVFNIIEVINTFNDINEIHLILSKLKILLISSKIDSSSSNKTIEKILKFIDQNNINRIFKLSGINEEIKKDLENIF